MRFDHIVLHVDNNLQELQTLKEALNAQGYPFDPAQSRRNREYASSNINIGNEYIEIVRLFKPKAKSWMPLWANEYDQGQRGAFCIFLEVEDVERTAVALKHTGIPARGPAVLSYPVFLGLINRETPYFIYYLPNFPGSSLQLAIMQYKRKSGREMFQLGMVPNAIQNGINGIRRVEVALPNLADSLEILRRTFPDLKQENECWASQMEKTRIIFRQSPNTDTQVRLSTITSQRNYVGKKFQIANVELVTLGG